MTDGGIAVAPGSAPRAVKQVIAAGNVIALAPYKWGGGHGHGGTTGTTAPDPCRSRCTAAGLLDGSLTSGGFARWGEPGAGRWITLYANADHVYMLVAGLRFDTSAQSRAGSRWTTEPRSSSGFTATHPPGL